MEIQDTIRALRERVSDYLSDKFPERAEQIRNRKQFRCINPEHQDDTPSMHVNPDGMRVRCFGQCARSMDIFDLADMFEELPSTGTEFYSKTVPTLAARYGIACPEVRITEQQAEKGRMLRVLTNALIVLKETMTLEHAKTRGLSEETCQKYGIGTIASYDDFIKKVVTAGSCDEEYLHKVLGFKPSVFRHDRLTITLLDKNGNPIAFSARFMDYKKPTEEEVKEAELTGRPLPKKYDCTRGNLVFDKENWLYGYNVARGVKQSSLYVVEGQLDCALCHQAGLPNTVALNGTAFTKGHVGLIEDLGYSNIVLALDADDAGVKTTLKIIESNFSGTGRFRLSVINYKDGHKDPAEVIQKGGAQAFKALETKSSFDFYLDQSWLRNTPQTEDELSAFCENMCRIAASEPSEFRRRQMAKKLSEVSKHPLSLIQSAIDTQVGIRTGKFETSMDNLRRDAMRKLQKADSFGVLSTLRSMNDAAEQAYSQFSKDDGVKPARVVIDVLDKIEQGGSTYATSRFIKLGHPAYDAAFDGIMPAVMTVLLANSSSGKSSFIGDAIPRILQANPDVSVLYHTTDDPVDIALFRMVCSLGQLDGDLVRADKLTDQERKRRSRVATHLKQLQADSRFEIRDSSSGYTLTYAERWIEGFKDRNPDRRILYICDNLFNTWISSDDVRAKVETAINHVKVRIAQRLDVAALCTVEPRKQDVGSFAKARLTKADAKETAGIELKAHAFWILHNGAPPGRPSEIPPNLGRSPVWTDHNGDDKPIVELEIAKDKAHGEGLSRFQFDPASYHFKEISCQRGTPKQIASAAAGQEDDP